MKPQQLYLNEDFSKPVNLTDASLGVIIKRCLKIPRSQYNKPMFLVHAPTLHVVTKKKLEEYGGKYLIISFKDCIVGYQKYNGVKGDLYKQAYLDYTLPEIKQIIKQVMAE